MTSSPTITVDAELPALAAGTLCAAFQTTAAARPAQVALRTPDDSVSITWAEYAHRVQRIGAGWPRSVSAGVTRSPSCWSTGPNFIWWTPR